VKNINNKKQKRRKDEILKKGVSLFIYICRRFTHDEDDEDQVFEWFDVVVEVDCGDRGVNDNDVVDGCWTADHRL